MLFTGLPAAVNVVIASSGLRIECHAKALTSHSWRFLEQPRAEDQKKL